MKRKKADKQLEYDDAPSGYVTLYSYKEPFMKFQDGFGYEGVLLFDGETDKIQCHFCGEWLHALGNHLHAEHNMTAAAYKEKVGLNSKTALISEKFRTKLIAHGLKKRMQNFKKNKHKVSELTKKRISETLKANCREKQNLRGTCPEQLIERLQKRYKELGYTPRDFEFSANETCIKVFGSWKNTCELAGIPYRAPGSTLKKRAPKYCRLDVINLCQKFLEKENRLPTMIDFGGANTSIWRTLQREGRKSIFEEVSKGPVVANRIIHTKTELLDFIKRFKESNQRDPSGSDCRRKLLPGYNIYLRTFGSLKNACKLI